MGEDVASAVYSKPGENRGVAVAAWRDKIVDEMLIPIIQTCPTKQATRQPFL